MRTCSELWSLQYQLSVLPLFFIHSPRSSRAATPIKSDTEFEIERERLVSDEGSQTDTTVWQWGELPSPSRTLAPPPPGETAETAAGGAAAAATAASETGSAAAATATAAASEERSMLSGMFSFMRKTKKARHDPVSEGIYLDDLNLESLDPEVAALYFPRSQALPGGDKGENSADILQDCCDFYISPGPQVCFSFLDPHAFLTGGKSVTCDLA